MTTQISNTAIKALLVAVNSATASTLSIQAANIDLAEKQVLAALLAGTATRVGINTSETSLAFKNVALAIANV
jgi:hypothetical protein